eukprot:380691_1
MALPSHYYPPHSHTPQYGTQRINMNAQYAVTPRINVNEQHLQHLQQQIGPIWSNDPNQTQTTNNNQTRPNAEQFATDTPGGRDTLPTGTATGNPSAPMDTDTPDGRDTMQNEIDTATDTNQNQSNQLMPLNSNPTPTNTQDGTGTVNQIQPTSDNQILPTLPSITTFDPVPHATNTNAPPVDAYPYVQSGFNPKSIAEQLKQKFEIMNRVHVNKKNKRKNVFKDPPPVRRAKRNTRNPKPNYTTPEGQATDDSESEGSSVIMIDKSQKKSDKSEMSDDDSSKVGRPIQFDIKELQKLIRRAKKAKKK